MNTNPSTTIAPAPPTAHTCYLCGSTAYTTFSHTVEDRTYVYVWCVRCAFGQYMTAV